jgi:hypothetical protein
MTNDWAPLGAWSPPAKAGSDREHYYLVLAT